MTSPARIALPGPHITSTAVPTNSAATTGAWLVTTPRVSAIPAPTVGSTGRRGVRGPAVPARQVAPSRGLYFRRGRSPRGWRRHGVSVPRRGAHRTVHRHAGHARRHDAPARRADRRGADDDPARRHGRVDDDAHARARLRAGRRVLLHRGPARRRAGHRRALLRQRLRRWPAPSTTSPSRPGASPRRRRPGSARRRRAAAGAGSDQLDALLERLAPLPPSEPIDAAVLAAVPERVLGGQGLFSTTGAVHAAAAFDRTGEILLTREDVGRHNAVDKVVGALLLAGQLPATGRGLFVSGRASVEMVQKAWAAGFGALVAVERADRARRARRPPGRPDARRLRPRRRLQRLRLLA